MKKYISHPITNFLLKVLFASLLIGALYYDIKLKGNVSELWAVFLVQFYSSKWVWLLLAIVLIPFNWLAETQKWHQFVSRYQAFSKWQAYKAILAGVSFSIFTPNRVGEYGGRILFVDTKHQWKAVIANLVGNFAQLLVLFSTGIAGGIWFVNHFFEVPSYWIYLFTISSILGLGVTFFAYYNIDLVIPIAKRIPYINHLKRFVKDIKVLKHFTANELSGILKWAYIRYFVYSTQYFLLLRFFGIDIGLIPAYFSIAAIFLIQTSIPLPPVMGLLARGNVAVQIWSFFGANQVSILATTFGLWIINLILPALFGTFFIFNVNITKSLGYDEDEKN
jgi:Lysylphosphatidylglycerol synthase TM region